MNPHEKNATHTVIRSLLKPWELPTSFSSSRVSDISFICSFLPVTNTIGDQAAQRPGLLLGESNTSSYLGIGREPKDTADNPAINKIPSYHIARTLLRIPLFNRPGRSWPGGPYTDTGRAVSRPRSSTAPHHHSPHILGTHTNVPRGLPYCAQWTCQSPSTSLKIVCGQPYYAM